MNRTWYRFGVAPAVIIAASAGADVVTEWNQAALDAVKATSAAPPPTARGLAMLHTAVYDAVNSITKTHHSYKFFEPAPATTSKEAAAAQAAHDVLVSLFPTQSGAFGAKLVEHLGKIADGPDKAAGIALGSSMASNVLTSRMSDGSTASSPYTPGTNPGDWQPAPPAFAGPAFQQYANVTCWGMPSQSAFRLGPPPALGSAEYEAAYDEVFRLGRSDSMDRTTEQTEIAHLWAAGGGTVTPPGQWNKIAQQLADSESNSLEENARMFALLNIATADAAICAWDMKKEYDYWRPITAITAADDTNSNTPQDATWTPLIATPPFQAYTSGHSTFSSAAAAVLAEFFGDDSQSFSLTADDVAITRMFSSLSSAAEEAGQSRIYGGIHWQFDNQVALESGTSLGLYVSANYLQVPTPGVISTLGLLGLAIVRRRR